LANPLKRLGGFVRRVTAGRHAAPVPSTPQRLALGLQGGGALGAFTWGVLDRLLEWPGFRPEAISGASAGAANAAVLASGLVRAGADGAKEDLERFWSRVGHMPSLLRKLPLQSWLGGAGQWDLPAIALEMTAAMISPYEFNPLNHHPLRGVLAEIIDFERLKTPAAPRLFVSATDVETGRARIFDNAAMTLDVILASACLPHLFQAVEIDGRAYWDGGYTANPPIAELAAFRDEGCRVLVVLLNPTLHAGVPRAARDIATRLNEILGNAGILRELNTFGPHETIARRVDGSPYPGGSKLNTDWQFIRHLRDEGRQAAEIWLAAS
jgi:NTE family protein